METRACRRSSSSALNIGRGFWVFEMRRLCRGFLPYANESAIQTPLALTPAPGTAPSNCTFETTYRGNRMRFGKQSGLALGLGVAAAVGLVACGGSDSVDAPTGAAPATPPTAITIAGTAVKGAALSGATVSIKCATGTASATSSADGRYSISMTGATLPCVLKVTGTEGSIFHSLVAGTSSTGTYVANISPLTELLVSNVAGTAPSTYFTTFGSSSTVAPTTVEQAMTYVQTALTGIADLSGVNPLTDTLVVGNALDQKIDTLMATLAAAGVTLDQVTTAIVENPTAPTVVAAPLAPPASACAWLRSGKYRMISPAETDPLWRFHVVQVDAASLKVTEQDGVVRTVTSDGACQFTLDDAESVNKIVVASGGLLIVHSESKADPTDRSISIGLPEQVLPISDFAGTWHMAGWDPASGSGTPGYVAQTEEVTIDSTGQVTALSSCLGLAACVPEVGPLPKLVANATKGGFDLIESGASSGRAALFKTLAGQSVFVLLADDGQVIVGTRKAPLASLPAVGTQSAFRQFTVNSSGAVTPLSEDSITVLAVDDAAKTVTRKLTSTNRVDMQAYDKPRNGLRYRAADSCTVDNAPVTCAEYVQLPLPGIGAVLTLSVGTSPMSAFWQVSVNKPN